MGDENKVQVARIIVTLTFSHFTSLESSRVVCLYICVCDNGLNSEVFVRYL